MAEPQSLYRRYRPQRFAEVRGQDHVTMALRNAVRDGRTSHAYLFSGPRGTGKTSSARILAKALNCEKPVDGEPCCECDSCLRVQTGTSLDVHELDAASNNGVDAMRDLSSKAALGTPGRWKVYIVDEVHMLSNAASNALLKTLEEPPSHVVFILATTDPQKVLPTVRSRTQHFDFHLLSGDVLADLLRDVNADAGLGVASDAIDLVVRRGRGSARDALSVLDQVAAAGVVAEEVPVSEELVEALCDRDAGRALTAVAEGCGAGRDPRRIAEELIEHLRNAFLATMAPHLVDLGDEGRTLVAAQAARLGPAAVVRAMEVVGTAITEMKESLDPRISLEVALVRLTRPDADASPAALLERIERLERSGPVASQPASAAAAPVPSRTEAEAATGPAIGPATGPATGPLTPTPAQPAAGAGPAPFRPASGAPSAGARAALGAVRGARPSRTPSGPPPAASPPAPAAVPPAPAAVPPAAVPPATERASAPSASQPSPGSSTTDGGEAPAASAGFPSRDDLTTAWGDGILQSLPGRARTRFSGGWFAGVEEGRAVFALPNAIHRDRCEEVRSDVEAALAAHFGVRVPLRLTVDAAPAPGRERAEPPAEEDVDVADLRDAGSAVASPEERLKQAFPGAEEVEGG